MQIQSEPTSDLERATVIGPGVIIQIDGLAVQDVNLGGPMEVAADRIVVWTSADDQLNFGGDTVQGDQSPLELYMEGNIVFRQGDNVIYAHSMYYDVRARNGIVYEAELLTPVEKYGPVEYEGLLRVKADVLRQMDQNLVAYGASITSSRLGIPRYWFQTETATLEDRSTPRIDRATGMSAVDPISGQLEMDRRLLATSRGNFVYLFGKPVFYWPVIATDLMKPSFYLDRFSIKNDSVFGTQALTDWDMYQLLGIGEPLDGTQWTSSLDYLSQRGFGVGTNFQYDRTSFLRWLGPVGGELDLWGLSDDGLDNLGADRRALQPEEEFRGRAFWRHRQLLQNGYQFTAELGWISDRNFLEQYYEREWDQLKDQSTGIELKQINGTGVWSITADFRVNDFFTQTEWLPRLDHYQIGFPIWGGGLTWFEHSSVGYARLRAATAPEDPVDTAKFNPLPWETQRDGVRVATRHEINLPISLGPAKVVPYAMGELAHWGNDLAGEDVSRALGQAGVRSSLPMWTVDPTVNSELFDLDGLAHKVSLDAEFFWSDASRNLDRFPLYDPLDDDAVEHFRRRFVDDTFGGLPSVNDIVPLRFDERNFLFRSGIQRWITSPTTEIADDLLVVQLGTRHRLQTKRGPLGRERTADWIVLGMQGTLFPKPGRDNFGEDAGLLSYDFRWHLGDRVTLVSDGFADTFSDGLRMITIGGFLTRPAYSSLYVGFRSIEGPISSNILETAFQYRLSPKWISRSSSAIDLGAVGNIGQSYEIIRVGESFLVGFGLNIDHSRDNVSLGLIVEPRFLASSRRAIIGGTKIPPLGGLGLE